jgi:hypothetical protein
MRRFSGWGIRISECFLLLGWVGIVTDSSSFCSYVRMLRSPGLYGVGVDYQDESDPTLIQKRADIIHSAAVLLEKCQLIKYERASGGCSDRPYSLID